MSRRRFVGEGVLGDEEGIGIEVVPVVGEQPGHRLDALGCKGDRLVDQERREGVDFAGDERGGVELHGNDRHLRRIDARLDEERLVDRIAGLLQPETLAFQTLRVRHRVGGERHHRRRVLLQRDADDLQSGALGVGEGDRVGRRQADQRRPGHDGRLEDRSRPTRA